MAKHGISFQRWSLSNLTEFEPFCKEEWATISVSRGAKMLDTCFKRLATVIATEVGSAK